MTREYYEHQVGEFMQGYRRGLEEGRDFCELRQERIAWRKLFGVVVAGSVIGCVSAFVIIYLALRALHAV